MKKIYLHVGLPKTATTSLQQHVFQNLDSKDYRYLGTMQPRSLNTDVLFRDICGYVEAKHPPYSTRDSIKVTIGRELSARSVVISEEMFTVDTGLCWQDKLERLHELFSGFKVDVLVTIREPSKAAFSLYIELWRQLHSRFGDFDGFLNSNQAKLYDYEYLLKSLYRFFDMSAVQVLPFETLGDNRIFIQSIETFLGTHLQIDRLPRENDTKKRKGHRVYIKPLSATELLNLKIQQEPTALKRLALRILRRTATPLRPLLNKISCSWTSASVQQPNFSYAVNLYSKSNHWLEEKTGIKYQQLPM